MVQCPICHNYMYEISPKEALKIMGANELALKLVSDSTKGVARKCSNCGLVLLFSKA